MEPSQELAPSPRSASKSGGCGAPMPPAHETAAVSSAVTFSTGIQGSHGPGADVVGCPAPPSVVAGEHPSLRGGVLRGAAT